MLNRVSGYSQLNIGQGILLKVVLLKANFPCCLPAYTLTLDSTILVGIRCQSLNNELSASDLGSGISGTRVIY